MSTLKPLDIRRALGRTVWFTPDPFGEDGWIFRHRSGTTTLIVSVADHPIGSGDEWIHASIAHRDHDPSYDDLKLLHHAVFGNRYAYQVFAPPAEHVNIHAHALHLWGRLDGKPVLPEFAEFGSI